MSASAENKEKTKSYKDTLNLPHTDFPLRAQAKIEDPKMLERWEQENLYAQAMEVNKENKRYILHDGPPYANGHIHLGHAYNKILKDIVTKVRRMMGLHVPVKPGWDCHGLPIELKVSQEKPGLSSVELKKACRAYADHWIKIQKEEFKKLGIIMDWEHPYLTMSPLYEADTVRAFGKLVEQKFVERKKKSVAWCMSCQTVLASAEIEYRDRKDPSVYVLFDVEKESIQHLLPHHTGSLSIVVWTTTPWTLPLNRAVAFKPGASYVILEVQGKLVVVGAQRADDLAHRLGIEKKIIAELTAEQLTGIKVHHPFVEGLQSPLIADQSVGLDEGTAFVHIAPGCGPIDYDIALKNNLEIYSPITSDGKYDEDIKPIELQGISVTDGQIWVLRRLIEKEKLLYKTNINHSYPHCWRCRNGLIFRATLQWFFNLDHTHIRSQALEAINTKINFIPEQGRNFLRATTENRLEWCLSRQRVWGVPIIALLCKQCGHFYCTPALIEKVAQNIEKEGIEYWDQVSVRDLIKHTECAHCAGTEWIKEKDILDVWFESGVSHYSVLYPKHWYPADIYVEGVDQHRAWFQSSLLTSLVLEKDPCMKSIMTHGFTVDEKGQKMSKSLGNVVAPQHIVDRLGTDGLRLWVASIGNDGDAVVSENLLVNVEQVLRKIRNTCRALLMNLYDYNHEKDAISYDQLLPIDAYQLEYAATFNEDIVRAYEAGNFTVVFHHLAEYCANELSAFYIDILKDRLYVETANGLKRRSAQTVLWHILDILSRLIAPIMSFTAEQVTDFFQKNKKCSIHLQHFVKNSYSVAVDSRYQWEVIREIRTALLKALEGEREKGIIKHSLDARLTLFYDPAMKNYTLLTEFLKNIKNKQSAEDFFKELMIVSQCEIVEKNNDSLVSSLYPGLFVKVQHAQGVKCPRCWQWDTFNHPDHVCRRCQSIIQ